MPEQSRPRPSTMEYAAIPILELMTGQPPLIDLYHFVGNEYVLYCQADAPFTKNARNRLIDNKVNLLYFRVVNGRVAAGRNDLPTLLDAPPSEIPEIIKASLLYGSAFSTARDLFADPGSREVHRSIDGIVAALQRTIRRGPSSLAALISAMRHTDWLYAHAVNTCTYATALGSAIGLGNDDIAKLGFAGFLHDVGLLRVPDGIVGKSAPLTPDEDAILRRHPEWSIELLGPDVIERPVVHAIIWQHHERSDGSGYPRGLKEYQMHPLARVLILVDTFDRLTMDYGDTPPLQVYEALLKMERTVRTKFNQNLFVAFVRLLGQAGGLDSRGSSVSH